METIYRTWSETVALFEQRGLPASSYQNLYEEEYVLHPGPASLSRSLWLDDHEHRHQNPWIKAGGRPQYEGVDGAVTGYVIDGDLQVEGNIVNLDYGSPALTVLGDLRAAGLVLAGDAKLLVQGDVEVETFVGVMTDKLVMIHGDLRSTLTVLGCEFSPDLVGGGLIGRTLAPEYLDLTADGVGRVEDPAPDTDLADLVVPDVLVAPGDPGDDGPLADLGIRWSPMLDRLLRGLPLVKGGRTVAPLEAPAPR